MKLSPKGIYQGKQKGIYQGKQKAEESTFYIVQQNNLAYPSVMNKDQFEDYCGSMKIKDFPLTVREGRFESFKQVVIIQSITDTEGDEDRKCPKCRTWRSYHAWQNNECAICDNTEEELRLKAAPQHENVPGIRESRFTDTEGEVKKHLFPFKPGDNVRSLMLERYGEIFHVLSVNPGEDWEPGSRHACITVQMPDGRQGLVDATEIEML